MKKYLLCILVIAISGCSSSGAVPIGQDTYMITKQSAGGAFVNPSSILAEIVKEGVAYCKNLGKEFQIVNTQELSAIPLARMPSAEVQFMCLNEGDYERQRPKLQKMPDTVIETRER